MACQGNAALLQFVFVLKDGWKMVKSAISSPSHVTSSRSIPTDSSSRSSTTIK